MAGYMDELSLKLSAKDEMSARLRGVKTELKSLEKQMATTRHELETTGSPQAAAQLRKLEKQYADLAVAQRKAAKENAANEASMKKLRAEAGRSQTAAAKVGRAWVKTSSIFQNNVVAGISAVSLAFAGRQAIKAYAEAEKQQMQLNQAYQKFPAIADVTRQSYDALNYSLMQLSGTDDDASASAEATLARFTLTGAEIQKLMPLLNDYAIFTGQAIPDAAATLGKAFLGNAKALKTMGINFKATGNKATDLQTIMNLLEQKVGGVAAAFGQTTAGKIAIAQQNLENLQETIGATLVPALTLMLGIIKPIVDVFLSLPKPLQSAIVLIGALGAAALVATPRLISLKASMVSNGTAFTSFGLKAGKTAGAIAGITVALGALRSMADESGNVFTQANFFADGLDEAVREIANPGWWSTSLNFLAGITDALVPHNTYLDDAKKMVADYDKELTDLVSAGKAAKAKELFDKLANGAAKSGISVDEVRKLLPGYSRSLDTAAGKTGDLGATAWDSAQKILELRDAIDSLDASINLARSYVSFKKSVKEYITKPSQDAALAMASSYTSMVNTFADGSKEQAKFITANQGKVYEAIRKAGLPSEFRDPILADLEATKKKAAEVINNLKAMDGKTVTITLKTVTEAPFKSVPDTMKKTNDTNGYWGVGPTGGLKWIPTRADGGFVYGAGTGISDSIPTMLSNGEFVIRAAAAKAIGSEGLHRMNHAEKNLPPIAAPTTFNPSNPTQLGRDAPLVGTLIMQPTGQVDIELALAREARRQERDRRTRMTGATR